MLILSRKSGESIQIGDSHILIKQVTKNRVVIGLDFPEDVKIFRGDKLNTAEPSEESPHTDPVEVGHG